MGLLVYHWLDFLIGGWCLRLQADHSPSLVVVERGWWDLAVDPRRYSLIAPARLVKALGRLLPRPDLVILLEAPPGALVRRKQEIAPTELARQTHQWRSVLPPEVPTVRLDASQAQRIVVDGACRAVVSAAKRRVASRSGAGWINLGGGAPPRWTLPRAPRDAARRSVLVHQPVTTAQRVRWEAARLAAGAGAFRLMPRGHPPPADVREALEAYMPRRGTLAVARGRRPGRYTALLLSDGDSRFRFAKLATDRSGRLALGREAEAIQHLAPRLPAPLAAPKLLSSHAGVLLFEGAAWLPRTRAWELPEVVGLALGRWFRASSGEAGRLAGTAHGDCAPWNLLRSREGWLLVDWEDARPAAAPFYDLFHFVVQAHCLLGKPSAAAVIAAAKGSGRLGAIVRDYADAAGVDASEAPNYLTSYLTSTLPQLDPSELDGARGINGRRTLLDAL